MAKFKSNVIADKTSKFGREITQLVREAYGSYPPGGDLWSSSNELLAALERFEYEVRRNRVK